MQQLGAVYSVAVRAVAAVVGAAVRAAGVHGAAGSRRACPEAAAGSRRGWRAGVRARRAQRATSGVSGRWLAAGTAGGVCNTSGVLT